MLTNKGLLDLAEMLESGKTTAVEIASAYIEKIPEKDKNINSYTDFEAERLLAAAKESDERRQQGKALSKFDGVPVAIKDNINTKGITTSCGSNILRDFISPYDATVIEKMKAAGFLILGKVNMDEFAMGSTTESSCYGPTKNPHDLGCVPGGSSGGSAASVAAGLAPASLGSDTGGSIRQPASFCGTVGIKPTYGRVSRYGLVAFASSLDQIGTFARNVDDAAALLAVISGGDKLDSTSVEKEIDFAPENLSSDISGLTIGIPTEYYQGVNDDIKKAIDDKVEECKKMGATVKEVSLKYVDYAIPVYYLIATAEASSNLARFDGVRYGYRSANIKSLTDLYNMTRAEGFGSEVKRRIVLGTFSLSSGYYDAYYLRALKGRNVIIQDFKKVFEDVDVLITPVVPTTAFKIGEKTSNPLEMYMSDILTISANLAAIPGMSIPVGKDQNDLPIGLQIMATHFNEKTMLNVAKAIESTCEKVEPVE